MEQDFFTILLAKAGHQVTGIDLTPDMIKIASSWQKKSRQSVKFAVMDAENPEFQEGTFDVIVSRESDLDAAACKACIWRVASCAEKGRCAAEF